MKEEVLYRFISNQASPEEKNEVRNWVQVSEERKKELNRLKNIWILSGLEFVIDKKLKDEEIEKIKNIIRRLTLKENKKTLMLRFLRYAAAVLILISISGTIGYFVSNQSFKPNSEITKIIVPKGQRSTVILPDGSTVYLNSDSQLNFPSFFNSSKRKVQLIGEGFFKVSHDKSHPFVVETKGLDVEVLGTSFNVSSYPDDQVITTYLQTGKVKISDSAGEDVFLSPSEAFTFNKITHRSEKVVVEDQRFSDWTIGLLTVEGETIGELVKKLERRFDVKIEFLDENVKQHLYTGSIKDQDLNTVMEALAFASSIKYERRGNKVLFSSK